MSSAMTIEQVRNNWRTMLYNRSHTEYPRGAAFISVANLATELFRVDSMVSSSQNSCTGCEYAENPVDDRLGYVVHADGITTNSTMEWVNSMCLKTRRACPQCRSTMNQIFFYKDVPSVLVLEYPFQNIVTSHRLEFRSDTRMNTLVLRGIVYHGDNHFTSRIVSLDNQVWYHDGMTTGRLCASDGLLNDLCDNDLRMCREKNLVLAVYAQSL